MGQLTRRVLLGTVGAAALGGVAYGGSRIACRFVPRNHPDFFSLLDDLDSGGAAAQRLGREALRTVMASQDLGDLVGSLQGRPLIAEAVATQCPTTRKRMVQDQCAEDFAEGRVLIVDGWVLSETETKFCAVRVLSGEPQAA